MITAVRNSELDRLLQAAIRHHQAGRLRDAEPIYRDVLARDPDHPDALALLGLVAHQTGDHSTAIGLIERSLEFAPAVPWPHNNLGEAYRAAGRVDDAIDRYRAAIALKRDYADAWNNLGIALAGAGDRTEAEAAYRTAIAADRTNPQAHANLGDLLDQTGRRDEAVAAWTRAAAINPRYVKPRHNLAVAMLDRGDLPAAASHAQRVVELEPDHAEAHLTLATVSLLTGDLRAGFERYEWRWQSPRFPDAPRAAYTAPLWDGSALGGRTILLHAEQGLGDTLQFVRYAPLVAARGGRVVLECQPELVPLLRSVSGVERVVARGDAAPDHDCRAPLLSLPRLFRTELETIPATTPYVQPDAARLNQWRSRIHPGAKLKVGLAWRGAPGHANDRNRSMPAALLAPLAGVQGVEWYSLQKRDSLAEPWPAFPVVDLMPETRDFADTAAIVAQLNLVLTVDTAVAHLAGAMGKRVWTLLPYASDWRWMTKRDDSPWYPSMSLIRQPAPAAWAPVVDRARARVATLVEEHMLRARAG